MRRVAVDQVDALPGDPDAAVGQHQAMQRGAGEDALARTVQALPPPSSIDTWPTMRLVRERGSCE